MVAMDGDELEGSQASVQTDSGTPAGHVAIEMEPEVPPTPAKETLAKPIMSVSASA
jgi:hypothetical protein